jgi:ribosomal-protein-alanine N-acetyltransferase
MTPDALSSLHAAAFAPERPWSAEEFAGLLASPGALLVGDGRAFLLARVTLDEAEVLTLATDPAHRRQGLARDLLLRFHGEAARRGAARAVLEVAESNAPARALYEGAGYAAVGRRPAYYPRPGAAPGCAVAALVLARALPQPEPRTRGAQANMR